MHNQLIKIINTDDKTIQSLRDWLTSHPDYFKDGVTDCHDINDVIYFRMHDAQRIMFIGDQFLCDIYSNELWVVDLIVKPVYDKIRKQKLHITPIVKVVDDCTDKFPCFNGYWLIPDDFSRKEPVTD